MKLKKIVITGGPSTGKTSVITQLEKEGHHCLHEVIRQMTADKMQEEGSAAFLTNPILSVSDPKKFNQDLLDQRIGQYLSVTDSTEQFVFFDRGIPDVLAYMHCFEQSVGDNFEKAAQTYRYDMVFHMPPWREIHMVDTERFETYEAALKIDSFLLKAYSSLGYVPVVVPKTSVKARTDFILDRIKQN